MRPGHALGHEFLQEQGGGHRAGQRRVRPCCRDRRRRRRASRHRASTAASATAGRRPRRRRPAGRRRARRHWRTGRAGRARARPGRRRSGSRNRGSARASSSAARASASARISRPSASVLPISTVRPLRLLRMSPGRKAAPETAFSTAGISRWSRTGSFGRHDQPGERQRVRRAAHVLLHQPHAGRRLDVEPAGIEADALADDGEPRMALVAPFELDQPRLAARRRRRGRPRRSSDSLRRAPRRAVTATLRAALLGERSRRGLAARPGRGRRPAC